MANTAVRKHRTVRAVAVVLYVLSGLFLLAGIVAALAVARVGVGAGWGPGWRGWLPISVVAAGLVNALFFLVLGSILFFLASIDRNMSVMRARLQAGRESGRRPAAPADAPGAAAASAAATSAVEAASPPPPAMEAAQVETPAGSEIATGPADLPSEPGPAAEAAAVTLPAPNGPAAVLPIADAEPPHAGEVTSPAAPMVDDAEPAEATFVDEAPMAGPETPALPQVEIGDYDEWDEDDEARTVAGGPAAARQFPGAEEAARMAGEMEAMRRERQWQEALELRARMAADLAASQARGEPEHAAEQGQAGHDASPAEQAPGDQPPADAGTGRPAAAEGDERSDAAGGA
jgi:hypothetical protein